MGRIYTQIIHDDLVTVSGLTKYWRVCRPTATRILAVWGLPPADDRPLRYRWDDIWRCEGYAHVPSRLRPDMKRALWTVNEIVDPEARGRSAETLRRHARLSKLPTVPLGLSDWRFRPCEIVRYFPDLAAETD